MISNLLILPLSFFLLACNPMRMMQKEIKNYGYIPMTTPMQKSGTGTLIAGQPKSFSIIAPPEECFPKQENGEPTNFRFYDKSTLPTKIKNITASGRAKIDLIEIAALGGVPIGIGTQFERVKTLGLEMKGVSIEYMNAPRITEYYRNGMSEMCKIYLDFSGFIFQAIKVDQLIYTFYGDQGQKIELDTGVLEEIIDVGFEVEYQIENQAELVINNPTYLGYQLGSLRYEDYGLSIYRSTRTTKNKWRWKSLDLFKRF
jgi:hypothetical protein